MLISIKANVIKHDENTFFEILLLYHIHVNEKNKAIKTNIDTGDRYLGFVEVLSGLNVGDKVVAEGTKKVRPNLIIRPIKKGAKVANQNKSSWGGKKKKDTKENKNGMFAWLQKLNIFKKSESEKQENKK